MSGATKAARFGDGGKPVHDPRGTAVLEDAVIILAGVPYKLSWTRGAMFRADEIGLFGESVTGLGFARASKYVWAMLPDAGRQKFPRAEDISEVLPALKEVWPLVNRAIAKGGAATDPKNVVGSTNGRSPSSS